MQLQASEFRMLNFTEENTATELFFSAGRYKLHGGSILTRYRPIGRGHSRVISHPVEGFFAERIQKKLLRPPRTTVSTCVTANGSSPTKNGFETPVKEKILRKKPTFLHPRI